MANESTPNEAHVSVENQKSSKHSRSKGPQREIVFGTDVAYLPLPSLILGVVGAFILGLSFYALWVIEPPTSWSSVGILISLISLGLCFYYSSVSETAVALGDAGVGVYDGQTRQSIAWYQLRTLCYSSGKLKLNPGDAKTELSFNLRANPGASAALFQAAQTKSWCALENEESLKMAIARLPQRLGQKRNVSDMQIAGRKCAVSKKAILVESDARFCPDCGQLFHRETLPEHCSECKAPLSERSLGQ